MQRRRRWGALLSRGAATALPLSVPQKEAVAAAVAEALAKAQVEAEGAAAAAVEAARAEARAAAVEETSGLLLDLMYLGTVRGERGEQWWSCGAAAEER